MQLDVHFRHHPESPGLLAAVRERLERALRPCGDRVGRVHVQLSDLNGPRGGVDTRCAVLVYLDGTPTTVHVESVGETPFQAIARAADRCGKAVSRSLERMRTRRRGRRGA